MRFCASRFLVLVAILPLAASLKAPYGCETLPPSEPKLTDGLADLFGPQLVVWGFKAAVMLVAAYVLLLGWLYRLGVPLWALGCLTVSLCFAAIRWNARRPALNSMGIVKRAPPELDRPPQTKLGERSPDRVRERRV